MSGLGGLSPKDLERLSAYVDRALPPSEMAEVEARLRADPAFRRAHEELRQVVVAVRALGEVRVPHNFTLRQVDVGRRSSFGYPVLRLATALASAAFVLLSGLRLLGPLGSQVAMAPMASEPQAEFAMRAADSLGMDEMPAAEAEATVQVELPLAPGMSATQGASTAGEAQTLPTPTVAGTAVSKTEDCAECPPASVLERGALETHGTATFMEEGELTASQEPENRVLRPGISWLAAAQWVLGLTAATLLVLTLQARRRG